MNSDFNVDHKPTSLNANTIEHTRSLSRGVRSRLNRHGFMDEIGAYRNHKITVSYPYDKIQGVSLTSVSRANKHDIDPVNLAAEENDDLTQNDISIQFAGYRAISKGESQSSCKAPR